MGCLRAQTEVIPESRVLSCEVLFMEGHMREQGPLYTSVPFVLFDVSQQMQTQTHTNNIHSTDTSLPFQLWLCP